VLARARELEPEPADVVLDYAGSGKNIAILEPLRGRPGWLACAHVSMSALESEDQLVFAGATDDGASRAREGGSVSIYGGLECHTAPSNKRINLTRPGAPLDWERSPRRLCAGR